MILWSIDFICFYYYFVFLLIIFRFTLQPMLELATAEVCLACIGMPTRKAFPMRPAIIIKPEINPATLSTNVELA